MLINISKATLNLLFFLMTNFLFWLIRRSSRSNIEVEKKSESIKAPLREDDKVEEFLSVVFSSVCVVCKDFS